MRSALGRDSAERPSAFSTRRCAALALAIAGHLALFAVLLRPPTPARLERLGLATDPHEAISARLIPRERSHLTYSGRQVSAPVRAAPTTPRPRPAPKQPVTQPSPMTTEAPTPALQPSGPSGYIPGGRDFTAARSPGISPAQRIPGDLQTNGMPAFRMADARTQGIAGAARLLQRFTGTADPACVDADAWGTMSEEERITHHASAADVTRIAIEHNCPPAPTQQGHQ